MPNYIYCGLNIQSNISFHELLRSSTNKVGLIFQLKTSKKESAKLLWSHHLFSPSGERVLSYCKKEDIHWLCFPELADFRISKNAKKIFCYPVAETSQETIRHLFLDQVLPRCLAYQGKIMIHASAIMFGNGLILFLGDSGSGKSTLAGNFHKAGNPVISDDCLWIKEGKSSIKGVPSYEGLRLWDDSLDALFPSEQKTDSMAQYSSKKRVCFDEYEIPRFCKNIPVLAVFVISPHFRNEVSEVRLDRLTHRDAFIALMKQSFHLDILDVKRIKRHMQALGRIVPILPFYRLSIPHDYDLLPFVHQQIVDVMSDVKHV